MPNNNKRMPFSVVVTQDTLDVLSLVRVQEGQLFLEHNMEKETENLDSDPSDQRCWKVDNTQRKTTNDFTSCINGYCEIFTERPKAFC